MEAPGFPMQAFYDLPIVFFLTQFKKTIFPDVLQWIKAFYFRRRFFRRHDSSPAILNPSKAASECLVLFSFLLG